MTTSNYPDRFFLCLFEPNSWRISVMLQRSNGARRTFRREWPPSDREPWPTEKLQKSRAQNTSLNYWQNILNGKLWEKNQILLKSFTHLAAQQRFPKLNFSSILKSWRRFMGTLILVSCYCLGHRSNLLVSVRPESSRSIWRQVKGVKRLGLSNLWN